MTAGPDLRHRAFICADYDQPQEVCSAANLSLPTSVVYITRLAVHGVPALSDRAVVDKQAGPLDATSENSNLRISALELQIASKDAHIAAKVVQFDSFESCLMIAQENTSLMSATIHEHSPLLHAAQAVRSSAEVDLCSGGSQLQVVCASESPLLKGMRQLH